MVKNLIFDLDNTIIKDEESYALPYKKALKKFGYDENDYMKLSKTIDEYDNSITEEEFFYDKEKLLKFVNEHANTNYSIDLINELLYGTSVYGAKDTYLDEETVIKLYEKYNLYVFTNYFGETQSKRLEALGYKKYFKKVFGADIYGCKQYKKSFEKVLKEIGAKPEECIMIGDSKGRDISAANNAGIKAILFDYNGKRDIKDIVLENYIVIHDMKELLNIL